MFARCLLCVFCLVALIGCGAEDEVIEEDEVSLDPDEGESSDGVSPDGYSGDIPVVTLSADGLWDEEGGELGIQYSLEIDRPLAHNLSIYLEYVSFGFEDLIDRNGSGRFLSGILQGETESLALFFGGLSNKLVLTILPASKQKEVTLPRDAFVGFKGDFAEEKIYFPVPEGYQFKPYRVGTPSQIVYKGEDIVKAEED